MVVPSRRWPEGTKWQVEAGPLPGSKILNASKDVCFSLSRLGSHTNIWPLLDIAHCIYYTTFGSLFCSRLQGDLSLHWHMWQSSRAWCAEGLGWIPTVTSVFCGANDFIVGGVSGDWQLGGDVMAEGSPCGCAAGVFPRGDSPGNRSKHDNLGILHTLISPRRSHLDLHLKCPLLSDNCNQTWIV